MIESKFKLDVRGYLHYFDQITHINYLSLMIASDTFQRYFYPNDIIILLYRKKIFYNQLVFKSLYIYIFKKKIILKILLTYIICSIIN